MTVRDVDRLVQDASRREALQRVQGVGVEIVVIGDCTLVPVEGGPHNIAWTHSEEVNRALLEFVAVKTPVTA